MSRPGRETALTIGDVPRALPMRTASTLLADVAIAALLLLASTARADEGGVSFWAPGQFGSLAAIPGEPGWSAPLVYYHSTADAGASKSFLVGGNLTTGIDATGDLLFFFPTYTFAQPPRLGSFKSRIYGIGPQIGYFFPVGKEKGYVNLKGYWEFAAQNRAEGWNLWLSLVLPLSLGT